MSSYFIALINIHDAVLYDQYLAGFDAAFTKYNGQVISVEDNPRILEGKWPAARTVLIKFPNEQELLRWYESKEYQRIAKYRRKASVGQIAVISGRD